MRRVGHQWLWALDHVLDDFDDAWLHGTAAEASDQDLRAFLRVLVALGRPSATVGGPRPTAWTVTNAGTDAPTDDATDMTAAVAGLAPSSANAAAPPGGVTSGGVRDGAHVSRDPDAGPSEDLAAAGEDLATDGRRACGQSGQ